MRSHWSAHSEPIAPLEGWVDVWAVRLDRMVGRIDELAATLSSAEQERSLAFRLEAPRQRYVVTRAALRALAGKYLGIAASAVEISNDPNGKPRLVCDGQWDFRINVAHSGNLAMLAVSIGCEVGVDVELLRPVNQAEQIARRYFHARELEAVLAADSASRDAVFFRCWTGKEAVLKAIGSGIVGPLASFCVPALEYGQAWIQLPTIVCQESARCWLQELSPPGAYVGAVACLGEERRLRCLAFDF